MVDEDGTDMAASGIQNVDNNTADYSGHADNENERGDHNHNNDDLILQLIFIGMRVGQASNQQPSWMILLMSSGICAGWAVIMVQ